MADSPAPPLRGRSRDRSRVPRDGRKKAPNLIEDDWTFIAVDQFTKYVQTVRRRGWYPIGSNPTLEVSSSRKKVTVLKAVTHEGDSFHCWTDENLTAEHGIRLVRALQAEFGEKLVIFLDRASYFYAKDLWEFVSGTRSTECVDDTSVECVQNELMKVWYFPSHLPELNPVEGYWNKLNNWFKYRLLDDLSDLKSTLATALDEVTTSGFFSYLCSDDRPEKLCKYF